MSFSGNIKKELSREQAPGMEARRTELYAILHFLGVFSDQKEDVYTARTDQVLLAKKIVLLMKEIDAGSTELEIATSEGKQKSRRYRIRIPSEIGHVLKTEVSRTVQIWYETGGLSDTDSNRAWLRGAFLTAGSMSDPEKSYHLEWILKTGEDANGLVQLAKIFDIEARITERKGRFVVYLKDSTDIVDMLNVLGAHKALMEMENVRILKEMRNSVNRQFNCDTANIKKIVRAAGKQVEDIRYIAGRIGLEKLPPALRQMAEVRLEYPDVSLQELGEYLDPPVGKSGVNHRLRKLSTIAENLRDGKQDPFGK